MTGSETSLVAAVLTHPALVSRFSDLLGENPDVFRLSGGLVYYSLDLSESEISDRANEIIRDVADGQTLDRSGQFDLQGLRQCQTFGAVLSSLKELSDRECMHSGLGVGENHEFRAEVLRLHRLVLLCAFCVSLREPSAPAIGTVVNEAFSGAAS